MDRFCLAVCTFEHESGLPEDRVSNQFPIFVPDGFNFAVEGWKIVDEIQDLYNIDGTLTSGLYQWLSPGISRAANACVVRIYDVSENLLGLSIADGGIPRGSPIWEGTFTLNATTQTEPLPEEVALVLTTRVAVYAELPVEGAGNTRPRQSGSGRVFLGPLSVGVLDDDALNRARPRQDILEAILDAFEDFKSSINNIEPTMAWCVWSRKQGVFLPVEHVQIDNAFDTQRRRGVRPTLRLTRDV